MRHNILYNRNLILEKTRDRIIALAIIISTSIIIIDAANVSSSIRDWTKERSDTIAGANITKAIDYLNYNNIHAKQPVTVAILDSGIDTLSNVLKPYLWVNEDEIIDGKDNDGNGYIDDINGWNFLGTKDGSFNMTSAGTEEYREFKRLYPKYKSGEVAPTDTAEYEYYKVMRQKAGIRGYLKFYEYNTQKSFIINEIDSIVQNTSTINADTLKLMSLPSLRVNHKSWQELTNVLTVDIIKSPKETTWLDYVSKQADELALMKSRIDGIENDADKRLLMGDDMNDFNDIYYGNNTLMAHSYEHGNFVASVIAGEVPGQYRGISNDYARLMIVRCAPDGDEYDKDVSTAIKYAVDNGAKVINMSLGKYCSPQAEKVNEAIAYARAKDALIVAAAGNNHRDIDSITYFPTAIDGNGARLDNYVRVGASSRNGSICELSNYGAKNVDIYAPGEHICGIYTDDVVELADGTSVAAPVVSAIAAIIRSIYPELRASEVKDVLISSAYHPNGAKHGILDALAAIKAAREKVADASIARQKAVEQAYSDVSISPQWFDNSSYLYYCVKEDDANKYYIVNAQNGKKESLISNPDNFVKEYASITGDTTMTSKAIKLYGLKLKNNNAQQIYWTRRGKDMVYNRKTGKLTQTEPSEESQMQGKLKLSESRSTNDSAYTMLGDKYNLYIRNNASGALKQITFDGKYLDSYCYKSAKDTISDKNPTGSWHKHIYLNFITDDSQVGDLYIIDALSKKRPRLSTKKMPLPNETGVRRFKLFRYDADKGEGGYVDIDRFTDQNVTLNYHKSDDKLFFVRRSRSVDSIELCRLDIQSGDLKVLVSEVSKPHINVSAFNYHLLNGGEKILWWSERSGRGNYYLYDANGKILNRVTQGEDIVVNNIERVDSLKNRIVFSAYRSSGSSDPCYLYYYTVNLDGSGQKLLTADDGTHKLTLSTDGKYAIDTYSRMDMPPAYSVVSVTNTTRRFEIYKTPTQPLSDAGWTAPKLFTVKADDGISDLYGMMYLPHNFDADKKYPIISNVYPGPQDDQIQRPFAINDNANQVLADMGFIVINVAPRGSSPWRGHDFYCFSYGNLRDYPIADDHQAILQLADRYKFIDLNKVGIYGHSGGGAMTVTAMLTYPDFYKVGVSASGNHDNNIYIQWWGETFHGLTTLGGIPTNAELAKNLAGDLLLISGDVDDNVPYASTLRLADALIKNNKRFDMMILPGKDHGLAGDYYEKLIRDYFIEHLLYK